MTTSCSGAPSKRNSTPPAVSGAPNVPRTMSSNAADSRGASGNTISGALAGHAPRKQRYVAPTASVSV